MKIIIACILLIVVFCNPVVAFADNTNITVQYLLTAQVCGGPYGEQNTLNSVHLSGVQCHASCYKDLADPGSVSTHYGVSDANGQCVVSFSTDECAVGNYVTLEGGLCPCGSGGLGCYFHNISSGEPIRLTSNSIGGEIFLDPSTQPTQSVPEFGPISGAIAGLGSIGSYLLLRMRSKRTNPATSSQIS